MGLCIDNTDDERLGNLSLEIRRESFVITQKDGERSEFLYSDLRALRVALDIAGDKRGSARPV